MHLCDALELMAATYFSECLLHFPSVFVPVLLRIFTAGQSDAINWKLILPSQWGAMVREQSSGSADRYLCRQIDICKAGGAQVPAIPLPPGPVSRQR